MDSSKMISDLAKVFNQLDPESPQTEPAHL